MIFICRVFCKDLKHTSSSDLFLPPKVNPRLRVFLGRGKVLIITNPSRIISTIRVAPRFLRQVHQQGNKLGFIKRSLEACLKTLDVRQRNMYKFSWISRWKSDMHVCIDYYENTLPLWSFRSCFLVIWLLHRLCLSVTRLWSWHDQYCCCKFSFVFFKGQIFYQTQDSLDSLLLKLSTAWNSCQSRRQIVTAVKAVNRLYQLRVLWKTSDKVVLLLMQQLILKLAIFFWIVDLVKAVDA